MNLRIKDENVNGLTPLKIDFGQAERFLRILDPEAREFTFQTIDDRKQDRPSEIRSGAFGDLKAWLASKNRDRFGIFVTVNRTDLRGRKSENITNVRAVWRELDGKTPEEALHFLEPSMIVESSPGKRHEYFVIDPAEPLSFEDFDGVMQFMVDAAGCDPNARDRARVLRLPGFYHCKREPVQSRLIDEGEWIYSRAEIREAFPPIHKAMGSGAPIAGDLAYTQANEVLVRSLIAAIPGEDAEIREDWLRLGFALARLGDTWIDDDSNDLRLCLWEALSRRAPSYVDGRTGCAELWDNLLRDARRNTEPKATIRTLLSAAVKNGWTLANGGIAPDLMPEAQESYLKIMGASEMLADVDPSALAALGDAATADDAAKCKAFRSKFRLEPFDEIGFNPNEEWLIKRLLPKCGTAVLFGASGSFKSFAAFDMGMHIALGRAWAGRKVTQASVVYIAAEGAQGLRKRKAGFAKQHGIAEAPLYLISAAPNLGTGAEDLKELIASVEEVGVVPGVIVLDTLAGCIGGGEENGPGMVQYIANAIALSLHFKCLVQSIHHNGHGDATRERGHSSLPAAMDVRILCERGDEGLSTIMSVKKMKDEDSNAKFNVSLSRLVLCLDSDGDEVSTLIVDSVEEDMGEGVSALADNVRVLQAIDRGGVGGVREIAKELGIGKTKANELKNDAMGRGHVKEVKAGVYRLTTLGRKALNDALGHGLPDELAEGVEEISVDVAKVKELALRVLDQISSEGRRASSSSISKEGLPKICQRHPFNKEEEAGFTTEHYTEAMEHLFLERIIDAHQINGKSVISLREASSGSAKGGNVEERGRLN